MNNFGFKICLTEKAGGGGVFPQILKQGDACKTFGAGPKFLYFLHYASVGLGKCFKHPKDYTRTVTVGDVLFNCGPCLDSITS